MKNILKLFVTLFSIIIIFLSVKCNKDSNNTHDTLPPITQEGKRSFGCKVNGKVWVPYFPCDITSPDNPCSEMHYTILPGYLYGNGSRVSPIYFAFIATRMENNFRSGFTIEQSLTNAYTPNITGTGNFFDSLNIQYNQYHSESWQLHQNAAPFTFMVTKIDSANHFMSGTFGFTLYERDPNQGNWVVDSIQVTDGRFDLPFDHEYCSCSN